MSETGWFEAEGYDSALIDGGNFQPVHVILASIGTVTSPKIRIVGLNDPAIVQFGGSVSIGGEDTDFDSVTRTFINHTWVLNKTRMGIIVPTLWWVAGASWLNRVWWDIPPGCSWWLNVQWP